MYTIKEASSRSGVGVPLLRAWERRYGVVAPTRSAGGYRLYDDAAIERLRAMRRLIADGWSAQQAAERIRGASEPEVAGLADIAGSPQPADPDVEDARDGLIRRIVDGARRIDSRAIEAALDEAFASARFEVAADEVVLPALREIGAAWERSEVSVAGEHAASHAVLRRMAMAFEAAGDSSPERPILVGLGPGSHHELGALAFAVAAKRAGLPVLYLGPNLPADSWVIAAETRDAAAAIIGVPTRADVRGVRDVLAALQSEQPNVLVAVGGAAAALAARDSGARTISAESLADAVAAARDALADRGS
jgi:DNA-binding transcriptional MerR regulator